MATNKHQNHRAKFEETFYFKKMAIQTERFPGAAFLLYPVAAYQQQSYSTYQGYSGSIQDGSYSNFSGITGQTTPYSNYPQVPIFHAQHHQSGWSTGAGYHGNGDSHYPWGGVVTTGRPNTGKYGSSYHGNSHSHGNSFSHGNSYSHGHNSYGHNSYGNGLEYHHSPSSMNYGYRKPPWSMKNLDDE